MKRGASLVRKTPLRAKPAAFLVKPPRKLPEVPLNLTKPRAVIVRSAPTISVPKLPPARSESYRRWVGSLPCIVCQIEGYSQAAHPNQGRGLGQKASDLECFPLCSTRPGHMGHHYEHDNLIGMTLQDRRELELRYTAQTQAEATSAGRPELEQSK